MGFGTNLNNLGLSKHRPRLFYAAQKTGSLYVSSDEINFCE